MSKWIWFYDLIDQKLGPMFAEHHFTKLTGKAYEEDENNNRSASVFYMSDSGIKASVDLLTRYDNLESDPSLIYLVRVGVAKDSLKEWLYPNIRAETKDVNLWRGWKCLTEDDVKNAFDEIELGLRKYLSEQE